MLVSGRSRDRTKPPPHRGLTTYHQCLSFSLQQNWTNKFSANISVFEFATSTQIYDGRTLRKGDVLRIENYFGTGYTAVQETSEAVLALKGTGFGTTASHTWEFVPTQDGLATMLVHRESWRGGVSFLFMRFGPVRRLLEEMFERFNEEVKESAESAVQG